MIQLQEDLNNNNNNNNFYDKWKNLGNEKSDTQKFWLEIIRDILGYDNPEDFIEFEQRVDTGHVNFIDAYVQSSCTVIEQKGSNIDLDKSYLQSDGSALTPFLQAKKYYDWLPKSDRGRYIVVSNFKEIRIYDMDSKNIHKIKPIIILLENLERKKKDLEFLIDPEKNISHEEKISQQAGKLIQKLRDELKKRYIVNENKSKNINNNNNDLDDLTKFCVRIVFLLYAEDSGLLNKSQFHDYLKPRELVARDALKKLFCVLAQKIDERDPYLETDLKNFPYVNGGLFKGEIEIPGLDGEPFKIILEEMSEGFNWNEINPTIFGAIFESVLNNKEQHSGGMHYTSPENIHKLIDPLFMDDLNKEFERILKLKKSERKTKLNKFWDHISSLIFFDPACGSGNFLTETYLTLRKLENKILIELSKDDNITYSKVSIFQFFGLEIDNFAVEVARTALLIAENQMYNATNRIIALREAPLPLKNHENIKHDDALKVSWDFVKGDKIFIIGNPPFLGYSNQESKQKEELKNIFRDESGKFYKCSGKIDYVAGWYFKACEFMQNNKNVKSAFVSTNSITQGEQVTNIFKILRERFKIQIDFAYKNFRWENKAENIAHVYVVIIGFSLQNEKNEKNEKYNDAPKKLFIDDKNFKLVKHINFYLTEGPDVFIEARKNPICENVPVMIAGGKPVEGGNLILTAEERDELLKSDPIAKKFIRPFMGGEDFLKRKPRYCLWLVGANPDEIKKCPRVMARIKKVREFREKSKKEATRRKAETPMLFNEIVECKTNYLAIPEISSCARKYIPVDWLSPDVISSNSLRIILNADLYHFGILTSIVHMAWMRCVCGKMGTSYDYSNTIVYNNFIWPSPSEKQETKIEMSAKKIIEARNLYSENSFATLYDENLMPPELRKAHKENDEAVCEAYGWAKNISEGEIVSKLFEMYDDKIKE